MTTTFETARVGDKVWTIGRGWGEIISVDAGDDYPIKVKFGDNLSLYFTLDGKQMKSHERQTLFWGVVEYEVPVKPLPFLEVDAKVLVWVDPKQKHRRHFSHFTKGGIYTFERGFTSFTKPHRSSVTYWPYWALADDIP